MKHIYEYLTQMTQMKINENNKQIINDDCLVVLEPFKQDWKKYQNINHWIKYMYEYLWIYTICSIQICNAIINRMRRNIVITNIAR